MNVQTLKPVERLDHDSIVMYCKVRNESEGGEIYSVLDDEV